MRKDLGLAMGSTSRTRDRVSLRLHIATAPLFWIGTSDPLGDPARQAGACCRAWAVDAALLAQGRVTAASASRRCHRGRSICQPFFVDSSSIPALRASGGWLRAWSAALRTGSRGWPDGRAPGHA